LAAGGEQLISIT